MMIISWYFGSEFLGHTKASDLLEKFLQGLQSLNQANMVHVSVDGPSTNSKFYEEFVKQKDAEELPTLINMAAAVFT